MGKQRNEDRQHGAGNGGVVPPVDRRWKPGQSGNPAGRPKNAGATKKEWLNTFAAQGLTEDELRRMERDPKAPQPKRAAAQQMLHARMPQMADY